MEKMIEIPERCILELKNVTDYVFSKYSRYRKLSNKYALENDSANETKYGVYMLMYDEIHDKLQPIMHELYYDRIFKNRGLNGCKVTPTNKPVVRKTVRKPATRKAKRA